MTTKILADARPTKGFFLDMFTRDLSLEDCILDLVDNSVDSMIRMRKIDVSETLLPLEAPNEEKHQKVLLPPLDISISIDPERFQIIDNCGGISVQQAKEEVFRIGHIKGTMEGQLGVYGIGLKRAIFKIGNDITIESRTVHEGFRMVIEVPKWSEEDKDWNLPFDVIDGAGVQEKTGTKIEITSFTQEISERFKSEAFKSHLKEMLERTYCLFLNRFVYITLNGQKIEPKNIPLGASENVSIAKEEFEENNVKVIIYAGLAGRTEENEWKQEDAGWYVACNGRLVLTADKNEETGWGTGMPIFVPKYRGFVGVVFFSSDKPLSLPWKTTKQGVNLESLVYQRTLTRMAIVSRPVITFLNSMFSSKESEKEPQRIAAADIKSVDIRTLTERPKNQFIAKVIKPGELTISVQFNVKQKEIDRIKKNLNKYSWSARKIVRYTFDYYLKTECPE